MLFIILLILIILLIIFFYNRYEHYNNLKNVIIIQKSSMHTEVIPGLLEALKFKANIDVLNQPNNWSNWINYYYNFYQYKFNFVSENQIKRKKYDVCIFVTARESDLADRILSQDCKIIRILHYGDESKELNTKKKFQYRNIALCPFLNVSWELPVYKIPLKNNINSLRWMNKKIISVGFQKVMQNEKDPESFCKSVISLGNNWKSIILARDNYLDNILNKYNIRIYHSLPTNELCSIVNTCSYLCTACSKNSVYRYDRLCGTIVIAISFCIPLIIDYELANLYKIPSEACILYDINTFNLEKIHNQTLQSYIKMSNAMKKYRDTIFHSQIKKWRLLQ